MRSRRSGVGTEARDALAHDLAHADRQAVAAMISVIALHRPSCSAMAPVSIRWRRISVAKNGLPSVSDPIASRSANPLSSQFVTGDGFHQLQELDVVEPAEVDELDAPLAAQRTERVGERMADAEIVGPVRPDHEQPHRLGRRRRRGGGVASVGLSAQCRSSSTSTVG